MPFCPECKREYLAGERKCAFCNLDLVAKLPVEKTPEVTLNGPAENEPGEMVTVVAFDNLAEARTVRNMLIDNGILCLLSDGSNSIDGLEFTLHVRPEDVFRTNSLLIPYMENPDSNDTENIEDNETDFPPVTEKRKRCPQCGNTQLTPVSSLFAGGNKWRCQNCGYEWKREKDD